MKFTVLAKIAVFALNVSSLSVKRDAKSPNLLEEDPYDADVEDNLDDDKRI